jgi:PAS domain S-box-containing protein
MERTKELAESESQYRVLIEEINDGYFVNQDGIIVFANGAFCEIHGYAVSEVIGRPYINFIAQESLSEVQKLYEERISKGYADDLYVYFRHHKNGNSLPTENKVKLMTYHGESAVAGICRDITERMEMEGRIRESESLAHIGQLTTSLAHEIRNPLSSVKMNIQILLKNIQFSGNDKRRMEIMASEISRLERILAEMLDFARPLRLNLSSASINEIIDACLEIMDVRVNEKNLVVKKRYSKNIPYTLMDHDKIEQAIINVLLNSVEALKGGGEIKVTTKRVIKDGETIIVEIGDNGPGINLEDLPYVFDPFFSNKRKGTGLGLSNTKKIIEAHGGIVAVAKEKKRGLLCRFSIPVRERPYE